MHCIKRSGRTIVRIKQAKESKMEGNAKVIAVTGKGGVGKTSLAAALVRRLTERYPEAKVLAIDADPAVGLATALDAEVKETLDDIRLEITDGVSEKLKETQDILSEAKFRILDMMDEKNGFAFVAIGRPESSGCYCAINSYLRDVISMLAGQFDYVVIDGEAGIEQVNRRVMEQVTHLLLVTDQSRKGMQVIQTIKEVADRLVMYEKLGVAVNRITQTVIPMESPFPDEPFIQIKNDEAQIVNDIQGKSVFELPEDSLLMKGADEILEALKL